MKIHLVKLMHQFPQVYAFHANNIQYPSEKRQLIHEKHLYRSYFQEKLQHQPSHILLLIRFIKSTQQFLPKKPTKRVWDKLEM